MNRRQVLALVAGMPILLACATLANDKPRGASMNLPNYVAGPDSPMMGDGDSGLRIGFAQRTTSAVFNANSPWPLYGSYRTDAATMAEFGGVRVDDHMLIVVTHKDSKGIFTGRVLRDDPPPKNVTDTADVGGRVISSGGHFAVDLKVQCRLPERPGKYWVVVLLGKTASPVLEFEVR